MFIKVLGCSMWIWHVQVKNTLEQCRKGIVKNHTRKLGIRIPVCKHSRENIPTFFYTSMYSSMAESEGEWHI